MSYFVAKFNIAQDLVSSAEILSPELESLSEALEWKQKTGGFIISNEVENKKHKRDIIATKLKEQFGESLIEESDGEEDPYNWWLQDVTVTDIIDFIQSL